MLDLSNAPDLTMGSNLIPAGTVVKCSVLIEPERKSQEGNPVHNVTLEVIEGQYIGAKMFDNIVLGGKAKEWGLGKLKHIAEMTLGAHLPGKEELYKVNSPVSLSGGSAVVKVDVEPHFSEKKGKWFHRNKVASYGSPREDSSTYKIYEAWATKTQPWQTDELPPLPAAQKNTTSYSNDFGHAGVDVPVNAYGL